MPKCFESKDFDIKKAIKIIEYRKKVGGIVKKYDEKSESEEEETDIIKKLDVEEVKQGKKDFLNQKPFFKK